MKTELKNEIKALINGYTLDEPKHHHSVMSEKTIRTMLIELGVLPGKIDEAVEALSNMPDSSNVDSGMSEVQSDMSDEELHEKLDQELKALGWK